MLPMNLAAPRIRRALSACRRVTIAGFAAWDNRFRGQEVATQAINVVLPVLTVEGFEPPLCVVEGIEGADVDVNLRGVTSRPIVGVNPASRAKPVFSGLGAEAIASFDVVSTEGAKITGLDDQMQDPLARAN